MTEQLEQSDPNRDTLPPEPPHPCPQQELRSALGAAQDVIGEIAKNLIALSGELVRIGESADRIIAPQPKEVLNVNTESEPAVSR